MHLPQSTEFLQALEHKKPILLLAIARAIKNVELWVSGLVAFHSVAAFDDLSYILVRYVRTPERHEEKRHRTGAAHPQHYCSAGGSAQVAAALTVSVTQGASGTALDGDSMILHT
ncbi:hypothetical protein BLNAU_3041 [Blattamonas nauphoetae]|uniref:Uncharacterized protein n=1 Tax=Blattamonas nauphoetae TaxID=2049346 RepID=A0ABQ9YE79_9EUKA|nr:hypothetical protein BLNAU_3041 [Blattamonas nauphoetae]